MARHKCSKVMSSLAWSIFSKEVKRLEWNECKDEVREAAEGRP